MVRAGVEMRRHSNIMTGHTGRLAVAVLTIALLGLGSGMGRADELGRSEADDLVQLDFIVLLPSVVRL